MGEDTNIPSDSVILGNGEHIQIVNENENSTYDEQSCVLLEPETVTFVPVMSVVEGEEVVMYNIVDNQVKVEISEDNEEDVYTEVYTQEVPRPSKSKANSRQGPHTCKFCNKSFGQLVNLVTHERIHTGEKPFHCAVCQKPFSQQPNLWKHMRIHTGERPYQCDTCKKSFTQQANLTKHMRIHTGERPYACEYCGKRFTQQANLTKHVRLHTGERPFHCSFCSKTFVQQSNLERHERTHTGVKPFQCNVCFENFAQNAHLSKHLRSVHKTTVKTVSKNIVIQPCTEVEEMTTSYDDPDDLVAQCQTIQCDGTENETITGDLDQCQTIECKMCIPVLYCTKTGRIIRRMD